MIRYARQAAILGVTVTLVVVAAGLLGLFEALERETIDLRFVHARFTDDPMSDQIRFVDIDDGALESVGRWPWDRATMADAIDELRRAGARTVALDVILEDAQAAGATDQDALLAEALASGRCVLPVRAGEPVEYDRAWQSPEGREELVRLLETLGADVRVTPDEAAQRARLSGARYGRFRSRPLEFKKAAADLALQRLARERGGDFTFDEFVRKVAPGISEHVGDFPERAMLGRLWAQHESWRVLAPLLSDPRTDGSYRDRAPLPVFARAARKVGFVNVNLLRDPDGEVRMLPTRLPARGGSVLQLGLAAVSLHTGVAEVELPLEAGELRLAWPTTPTDWSGVLRRPGFDRAAAGRISIAVLVSLAEQRRTLARNREKQPELASFVLNREIMSVELTAELLREADGEAEFQLESARALVDQGQALSAEEQEHLGVHEQWRLLRSAVADGEAQIQAAEERLRAELSDRLVFVGMTATGASSDVVPTPLGPATPGVVVHAVVADMVLGGRRVQPVPAWANWMLALVLGLVCTSLSARLTPLVSTLAVAAVLAAYLLGAGWWAFGAGGHIVPMVGPVSAGAGAWVACTVLGAALFQSERTKITRRFKTRVSPQLVDYLLENPRALSMAGEQREVAVMFLDIAGFTAITEAVDGPAVVRALNRCMNEFTGCITRHGGYVNKFLGDGLMAFWSAFLEDRSQAARACRSALECVAAINRLNESGGLAGLPALSIRIGIATGKVVVGDFGAPPHLNDYTVIGGPVNLAARLETANKQFGTGILLDERTRELMEPGELRTRPIGRIIVAGQTVPVMVYELMPEGADPALVEVTTEAVQAFLDGKYGESARAWKRLAAQCGPTRLASWYLEVIEDPGSVVDGALRLLEK